METKIINVKVVVDGDESVKDLGTNLDKANASSKKLTASSKKLGTTTADALGGAEQAADNLSGGVSGIASQLKVVSVAAKKGGAAMRSALISTGVGALVVALGLVVQYWEEIGVFLGLINKDLENQHAFLKTNISLLDAQLGLLKKEEKFNKERGISNEENLKLQKELLTEKKKLLAEDIKILEAQLLKEESAAAELSTWQKFQILVGTIPKDLTLIDPEEQTRLNDLRKQILALKGEQIITDDALDPAPPKPKKRGKGVDAVKLEEETAIVDPADEELEIEIDKEVARLQAITDIRKQFNLKQQDLDAVDELAKIELERERDLAELDRLGATLEQKTELNKYYDSLALEQQKENSKASEKIAKLEAEAKVEALEFYASAAKSVSALVGKETSAGKGLAVASTLISTYLSAQKAYESQFAPLALVDSPIRGAIAAGVAVANGLANVKAILSVKTPAGGSGVSNSAGGRGAGAQAPSFNVVGNSGVSQIAQTLNQEQEPISRGQ